jgi:RHS repeat-associated protein
MRKAFSLLATCILLLVLPVSSVGQNTADGTPAFATIEHHDEYSINLQTLDVIINVPIRSKAAGAIPFNYSLGYDSECALQSNKWYCGYNNFTERTGMLGLGVRPTKTGLPYLCPDQTTVTYNMSKWVVVSKDQTTQTPLNTFNYIDTAGCYQRNFSDTTIDGTGINVAVTWTGNVDATLYYNATLTGADGKQVTLSGVNGLTNTISWPSSVTDAFGNSVWISTGTVFYDTLGKNVLTSSPNQWTWTDANGAAKFITATTTPYTQKFVNCGWTTSYSGVPFTTAYNFPDGTAESFTWESQYSGTKTGRVASILNRTGGTTSFGYGSMYCGISNGGPAYPTSLTRTTPDGIYTYTMGTAPSRVTTVLDPGKNKTVYTFSGDNTTIFPAAAVLTQVQKYQNTGTVASPVYTLLTTDIICYNTNQTNCPTAQVTFPITEKNFYHTINAMATSSRTQIKYDWSGNVTYVAKYDIGASSFTTATTSTYGSWNGSACVSVGYVRNLPCDVVTSDGTHTLSESRFTYNSAGAITAKAVWTGTAWLTTTYVPNSNGTVASKTDPNLLVTTYSYNGTGGCNSLLPTSVTANGLTSQTTYECNGGTVTSTTDESGNPSTFSFGDPMFRITSATDQSGLTTTTSYTSNSVTSSASFGSSSTQIITTVDGLGRPNDTQNKHGSSFDTASKIYQYSGTNRNTLKKVRCSTSTPGALCGGTTAVTTVLDPLGRTKSAADANGRTKSYTYSNNDMSVTLGPAPSGEHTKTTQTEYDGLGRVKSDCKILSSGGSSCGQGMGGSGIVDTYSYSFATGSSTVSVTRGSQTRTSVTDALGRIISRTTPEAGTVTYTYDSVPAGGDSCGARTSNGDLLRVTNNSGTYVCYTYDSLHRLTSAGTSGGTACRRFSYDNTNGFMNQGPPAGYTGTNLAGRMVEAETDDCTSPPSPAHLLTDEWLSYDKNGRLTDLWEKTPHSAGYYHTTASYFLNGEISAIGGIPSQSTITYGLDPDGKPNTAVSGTTNLVSGVTRNVFGEPLTVAVGNAGADSDTYGYDSVTGRTTSWTFTVGSTPKSQTGTLNWNPNGTLGQLVIGDDFNSGGAQTCNFAYDDVTRLVTDNCGSAWSQTFSYDQYDNLTKSGSSSWMPGYNAANNRYSTIGATYDGDGKLTYDSLNSYSWNAYGLMATVITGTGSFTCGTSGTCFAYDALGRMVEKSDGSTYTEMLYSPVGKTAQMSGSTVNYLYIPVPGGGTVYKTGSATYYQHKDWLGSARLESDVVNRTVIYDRAFAPYGEMYANFGQTGQLNFTGDTQDDAPNNGLFDTPARELASRQGRWLSPDPAGDGWNAYAYGTNPNSGVDPEGLLWESPGDLLSWVYMANGWLDTSGHVDTQTEVPPPPDVSGLPITTRQLPDLWAQAPPPSFVKTIQSAWTNFKASVESIYNEAIATIQMIQSSDPDIKAAGVRNALGIESVSIPGQQEQDTINPIGSVPVPQNVIKVLEVLDMAGRVTGSGPGLDKPYANDGRNGTQELPKIDAKGQPMVYHEWDIHPYDPAVNRGGERIVTGSDGRAYYTPNHYFDFTQLE